MMLYRFQVFYRLSKDGPLLDLHVEAETPEHAQTLIQGSGTIVHTVGPGEPVVSGNQFWFTKEEAAVYLRAKVTYEASPTLIDKLMADGKLPRPTSGRPFFSRPMLDRVYNVRMQQDEAA